MAEATTLPAPIWRREPKGPGRAFHMFKDAGGEQIELLVYDCPADSFGPRMCGFEIFARTRRGGPFHKQVASGDADSLEEAIRAVVSMSARPRAEWSKRPRPA